MSSTRDAEELAGGNMSGAVVRIGDTVRKPTGPQSRTVQRLVAHVRAEGVAWAAEPLGTDAEGRDVWRFIPGHVEHGSPDWLRSEELLVDIATRLRQWHDATASFQPSGEDVWWWPGKRPYEVICHVDFAPYNHVFVDRRFVGAIDFDLCYPGPRLWDLAYTAYRYVPLIPHVGEAVPDGAEPDRTELSPREALERLDTFLDAYGGDGHFRYSRRQLLGFVPPRLIAMADWCDVQDSASLRMNGVMYRAQAQWIAGGGLGPADDVEVPDL